MIGDTTPLAKLTLTNVDTAQTVEMQFNPEEFRSQLTVNYSRKKVQGWSHEPLHYGGTGNRTFTLGLFFIGHGVSEVGSIEQARLFLESLCYASREGARSRRSPPTVLVIWPRFLAMNTKIVSHSDIVTRFNRIGQPTGFTVELGFEEALDTKLFSEDVALQGYQRGGLGLE